MERSSTGDLLRKLSADSLDTAARDGGKVRRAGDRSRLSLALSQAVMLFTPDREVTSSHR